MRQAIGGTWILQLVISFMLIFVAFLALSVNYSKAFRVKNELVTILEKYEGASSGGTGAVAIMNNYLLYNNYTVLHSCEIGDYGVSSLTETALQKVNDKNTKYYYCIRKEKKATSNFPNRSRYQVRIFFKFNLPVLGDIFTFTVNGTTNDINIPSDNLE